MNIYYPINNHVMDKESAGTVFENADVSYIKT